MPKVDRPTVILWDLEGAALILDWPTGVIFTNQADGGSCMQPEVEGLLVPLNYDHPLDSPHLATDARLAALFDGGRIMGVDDKMAEAIDALLQENASTAFVRVDRERLRESMEAWVHVKVNSPPAHGLHGFTGHVGPGISGDQNSVLLLGFGHRRAVLTWRNSD